MARSYTVRGRITAEDAATPVIAKVEGRFKRFVTFLKSRLVITFGEVARAARAAFAAIESSAALEGQTRALAIQLAQQGQDLETFLNTLREVSLGTVSEAELISGAARALLLGIPAEEIANLLEIAAASAIAVGISTGQAFNDIAVGVGRASPLIIDNLGIVLKLGPAYEALALELGKSSDELTVAEQKTAILNAVLEAGAPRVDAFRNAQAELGLTLGKTNAALKDAATVAGNVTGRVFLGLIAIVSKIAEIFVSASRGVLIFAGGIATLVDLIPGLDIGLDSVNETLDSWDRQLTDTQNSLRDFSSRMADATFATTEMTDAQLAAAAAAAAHSDAQEGDNITIVGATDATLGFRDALIDQAAQADASTQANLDLARSLLEVGQASSFAGGGRGSLTSITTRSQFSAALSAGFSLAQVVRATVAGGGTIFVNRLSFSGGGSVLLDRPDLLTQFGERP